MSLGLKDPSGSNEGETEQSNQDTFFDNNSWINNIFKKI